MAKAAPIGPLGGLRGFPVNRAEYVHDTVINSAIHCAFDTSQARRANAPAPFPNTFVQVSGIKEATEAGLPEELGSAILNYVARRTPPGLPVHDLRVKVGGVYRLMRNMSAERGCITDVRAVIQDPDDHVTLLPRIPFETKVLSGHTLVRRQFPLSAEEATTFNSCQG